MVLITVGGPPGSGTSTVCKLLESDLKLDYIYAGQIFRDMAKEANLSLADFSIKCEVDPSIDLELDRRMMDRARSGEAILEGRMIGPLCNKNSIDSIRVYMDADPEIRARRVMERDGGDISSVMSQMAEREESERVRYMRYYNIDPTIFDWYDLVIDSSHITPEREAIMIKDLISRGSTE